MTPSRPFPWTKTLGAVACVAGIVEHSTQTAHPQVSYWANLVFKCAAGLGIWFARNNSTTSEQAGAVQPIPEEKASLANDEYARPVNKTSQESPKP